MQIEVYEDMYDCLQEGTIVIDQESNGSLQIQFANDLGLRILQKVLQTGPCSGEQLYHQFNNPINDQNSFQAKEIFFEYKNM